MKKALSLILTLCLLFGALPVQVFAAEESGTVRSIKYRLEKLRGELRQQLSKEGIMV